MSTPTKIEELEQRIERLESELWRKTFPAIPSPILPKTIDDDRCPVCHGRYKDMNAYVCSDPSCPSRVTFTCEVKP
jgi:hypothetical protein